MDTDAADFVRRFSEAWAAPTADKLTGLLHPEVVLVQPLTPTTEGREASRVALRRLLEVVPDLHGAVRDWSASADAIYIALTLRGTLARRPYEWPLVDRIVLEDGLVRERVSYFDPLPLIAESLKRPSRALAMLRLRRGA